MKKRIFTIATLIILFSTGWYACTNNKGASNAISVIFGKTYGNLVIDSAQLHNFFSNDTTFKKYKQQFIDFYKLRNYEYAWFDNNGLGEQAVNFKNLLDNTITAQEDSSLYNATLNTLVQYFVDSVEQANPDILKTELYLTGQFFVYAAKVFKGADVDIMKLGWFIPRKKINLSELLDSVIKTKGREQYITLLHPQYKKLQNYLIQYYQLQKQQPTWDSIPSPAKSYRQGDSNAVILQIKKRLHLLGDLARNDSTGRFDTALTEAVKNFQKRTGSTEDGVVGTKIITELNIPFQKRIRQILINMERLRWVPYNEDSSFILVNIPEYRLHVFEKGKKLFDMNVIVGSSANNTVIFTGKLQYVVFAPYWNVPASIVQKEIRPAMERNPNYIKRNNMEVTGFKKNGEPLIRQKPGYGNSLGKVKFLFPNNYNIYLHDTPNRSLFSQSSRGFSHGCIRISDPQKMAEYLLREQPEWTTDSITHSMKQHNEKWVVIKTPIPVVIAYFTAWVDVNGKINFRKDIYKHDEKVAAKLFAK